MRLILTVTVIAGIILFGFLTGPQQQADVFPSPTSDILAIRPTQTPEIGRDTAPQEPFSDTVPTPPAGPTIAILTPTPQQPLPTPTTMPTSSPEVQPTVSERNMHCDQPGCITWTYEISVPQTMHRWGVWSQFVGPGMMSWERFVYEVEYVNPILTSDGHMFKVNKSYFLPECINMEDH